MVKKKILFVCLGNICRSPLAEAIFKHKLKKRGIEHQFEVDSCGTANYHIGDAPDSRSIANARKNGVTIDHIGRQLQARDLDHYDLILAMDKSNLTNIFRLQTEEGHLEKIKLMREFDPLQNGEEVPDPYYGGEGGFQQVFDILDRSTETLIENLIAKD
jgi:protein-tyrosine phosphatase